jgi:hypothetical protein
MMMPPPPDMGGAPPGGGAPATDPNEAGPRGNVPEASNERREGLKYNAGFEGKVGNLDDLANMTRGWPEDMRRRATQIFANPDSVSVPQVVHEGAATISETETEEETSDPTTWELGHNQKADEQDGKSIILEGSNRLFVPAEPGKRYALIDPLAEPLDELEETDEDLEGKDEPIENKSEDAKSA